MEEARFTKVGKGGTGDGSEELKGNNETNRHETRPSSQEA